MVESWSCAYLLVVVVDFGEEGDLFEWYEFFSVLYALECKFWLYGEEEGLVGCEYFVV